MKILHICSNYVGNQLFSSWFPKMGDLGLEQVVYIPIQQENLYGKYAIDHPNVRLNYRMIKKPIDRILYFKKIRKYFADAKKIKSFDNIGCIHAHMLYSDGGVAYLANKKFGIPYIVAVRSTDVNLFMKYFPHTRHFIKKVLKKASKVIFISPFYVDKVCSYLSEAEKKELLDKVEIIPNGISDFWIKNIAALPDKQLDKKVRLVQVGKITRRKNTITSIKVTKELLNRGYNATLDVVGDGELKNQCMELAIQLNIQDRVRFWGHINDLCKLLEIYRDCDIYIMPSITETFGVTYLEAMSQGLPLIYTQGQGIDGFFKNGEIGYSVDPMDTDMIVQSIENISLNYDKISKNCIDNIQMFNWDKICKRYIDLYKMLT